MMPAPAPPPWLLAVVAISCTAFGAWAYHRVRRWRLSRAITRRFRHARTGEDNARTWLERHGFTVLGAQVTQRAELVIDGVEAPFMVRADYLVERYGVRGVVEVKTGMVANPSARATRRQILEYAWVYGVAEVYLFDADTETLRRISVPARPFADGKVPSSMSWPMRMLLASGIVVAAAAVWWYLAN